MDYERRKGRKAMWDVRVIESKETGCVIEMLNSGILGWCPRGAEGHKSTNTDGKCQRLPVGWEGKMECVACPHNRWKGEKKHSPWPVEPSRKPKPVFSHYAYVEQQLAIEKAKELQAGTIIDVTAYKLINRGLLCEIDDKGTKGLLSMTDVSRKISSHKYMEKMFPPGTPMKAYVCHACKDTGRITLSTKEFEDDDHVGWMLSFPERCFKNAEAAVEKYHEKRDTYIQWLQREVHHRGIGNKWPRMETKKAY